MILANLTPGTRFRLPGTQITGRVLYANACRIGVRVDGTSRTVNWAPGTACVIVETSGPSAVEGRAKGGAMQHDDDQATAEVLAPAGPTGIPAAAGQPGTTSALSIPSRAEQRREELLPRTFAELTRLAEQMATSTWCPRDYHGRPQDILICMLHGAEVGLLPLQSLQWIAVINGRPGVWGDGALAIVQMSGLLADKQEWITKESSTEGNDNITAYCRLVRRGWPTPIETKFSVADAKRARLWAKAGPWAQYPRRMLQMRARSWALRDGFADALHGLAVLDEAQDITPLPAITDDTATAAPRRARTYSVDQDLAGEDTNDAGRDEHSTETTAAAEHRNGGD